MDIEAAIVFLKDCQRTHRKWAEYFKSNPEIEKEMVSSGQWEDAKAHRKLEQQYEEVIQIIANQSLEIDTQKDARLSLTGSYA